MSYRLRFRLATALLASTLLPGWAAAQSDASGQTVDQLSKRLDELRVEMNKIEARLDAMKTGPATPAQAAGVTPSVAPASQDGTIQTTQPLAEGQTSKQVGEATATYRNISEDSQ